MLFAATMSPRRACKYQRWPFPTLANILQILMMTVETLTKPLPRVVRATRLLVWRQLREMARQEYIFFTKNYNILNTNNLMNYMVVNKFINRLKIVTLLKYDKDYSEDLLSDIIALE